MAVQLQNAENKDVSKYKRITSNKVTYVDDK